MKVAFIFGPGGANEDPQGCASTGLTTAGIMRRRVLGGLINEYERAA